jgi:hypothetical protein
MKRSTVLVLKRSLTILALGAISVVATAQKLPTIQKNSLVAPTGIKIDGKANEWDDTFQAYNKSTDVYYSIANSADNLYLVVQATDPDIINKIISGGITFTIKNADKKNTADAVTITYPLKPKPAPHAASAPGAPGTVTSAGLGGGRGMGGGVIGGRGTGASGGGVAAKLKDEGPISDDDLAALNKQVSDNIKEIKITGVKEFPDSSVSIYNDEGVHAAGLINSKKAYTCEFSIALKYLQPLIGVAGTFNYNIMLNGLNMKAMTIVIDGKPADANSPQLANIMSIMASGPGGNSSFQSMASPTDFSGTYTLAKK